MLISHSIYGQVVPASVCNENCSPEYSSKKKEGEKFCHYDCVLCPEGMISEKTGRRQNVKHNYISNPQQSLCAQILISLSRRHKISVGERMRRRQYGREFWYPMTVPVFLG